jgi:hypothetical protein
VTTLQLQTAILRAHQEVKSGSHGARKKLERLQAEYRSGRHEIVRDGGTCRLIERDSSLTPPTMSRPRRRPPERSARRPYWLLGDDHRESWRLR